MGWGVSGGCGWDGAKEKGKSGTHWNSDTPAFRGDRNPPRYLPNVASQLLSPLCGVPETCLQMVSATYCATIFVGVRATENGERHIYRHFCCNFCRHFWRPSFRNKEYKHRMDNKKAPMR